MSTTSPPPSRQPRRPYYGFYTDYHDPNTTPRRKQHPRQLNDAYSYLDKLYQDMRYMEEDRLYDVDFNILGDGPTYSHACILRERTRYKLQHGAFCVYEILKLIDPHLFPWPPSSRTLPSNHHQDGVGGEGTSNLADDNDDHDHEDEGLDITTGQPLDHQQQQTMEYYYTEDMYKTPPPKQGPENPPPSPWSHLNRSHYRNFGSIDKPVYNESERPSLLSEDPYAGWSPSWVNPKKYRSILLWENNSYKKFFPKPCVEDTIAPLVKYKDLVQFRVSQLKTSHTPECLRDISLTEISDEDFSVIASEHAKAVEYLDGAVGTFELMIDRLRNPVKTTVTSNSI